MVGETVTQNLKDRLGSLKTTVTEEVNVLKTSAGLLKEVKPVQAAVNLVQGTANVPFNGIKRQLEITRRWL
jgi:hypothetical protein